jgi:hypothetical protein
MGSEKKCLVTKGEGLGSGEIDRSPGSRYHSSGVASIQRTQPRVLRDPAGTQPSSLKSHLIFISE